MLGACVVGLLTSRKARQPIQQNVSAPGRYDTVGPNPREAFPSLHLGLRWLLGPGLEPKASEYPLYFFFNASSMPWRRMARLLISESRRCDSFIGSIHELPTNNAVRPRTSETSI